jgi:hypothetical protein
MAKIIGTQTGGNSAISISSVFILLYSSTAFTIVGDASDEKKREAFVNFVREEDEDLDADVDGDDNSADSGNEYSSLLFNMLSDVVFNGDETICLLLIVNPATP